MFKFFGSGRTYWESSYFGGVKRVLSEYPFYKLNYDLHIDLDKTSKAYTELNMYQQEKLINILLNQAFTVKDYKAKFKAILHQEIFNTISSESLTEERLVVHYGKPKLKIPVSKGIIKDFISHARNTELASIFDEYGDSLIDHNTKVTILCDPPPKPEPSGKEGDGEAPDSKKLGKASGDGKSTGTSSKTSSKGKVLDEAELSKYAEKVARGFIDSYKDKKNVESYSVSVKNVARGYKFSYKNTEIVFARKLNQMLDITHDPKAEVVKNLLQGTVDAEKLAEVLSGNNRVHMNRLENESVKPFKVVVLGDYSGSMSGGWGGNKFGFQKKVMKSLFHLFHDIMGIEDVEFYGHSGGNDPVLYRFHSPEYPHFMETFESEICLNENYDGPIIEHIHKMVRAKSNKAVLLISLSDGQPSGNSYGGSKAIDNMKKIMEKIKRDNFITVGIGMLHTCTPNLYQYSVDLHDLTEASPVARIINRAVKENLVMED